ncbi:palmitoyl-protein thioesterase [Exophiala aquamarina CBS 119918]|uniref:Palmitoyl-protein thioesterase 1 n=1 Tax=Exophiala aquamarina CBS 119918 TaxID=1182545 RepID=A0A072P5F9_9EURO|nr:palmitoyl-protein thioesterase [Exophiala aquamarina CBS 119918]KEF55309.1 palmitoyl-protein thioesterase [Exophiala aquamarina CBS 119918]
MLLKTLPILLALPSTILSIVIVQPDVFSAFDKPELLGAQRHEGVPEYTSISPHPPQFETADARHRHRQQPTALSPKYATFPEILEEVLEEDDWVKITRLSPKHAYSPSTSVTDDDDDDDEDDPLPVVIWHGLGDSADADGLISVAELIDSIHPGTYTYIISPTGQSGSADRQASFYGNVTSQLSSVCTALASDRILRTAPAIDAVGFSQGGQFLRGYIQRCGGWAPRVRSLITFGSQHNGIAEFQKCASATDWICQGANALLKSSTVWSDFVQSRLVPAQYYRDPADYENYLAHSNFLADINNERAVKNATYVTNLAALEKFVMVVFRDDQTVVPKESGWFAEVNMTAEAERTVTQLRDRPIYKEDWIGLKQLDKKHGLDFVSVAGEHMQLNDRDLKRLFKTYFGPYGKTFEKVEEQQQAEEWKLEL